MIEALEPMAVLGEGGEGVVHLAWDGRLARWLAVKIVRLAENDRELGQRLIREIAPFAREPIDPPVVPILACGLSLEAPELFRQRFGLARGLAVYLVMPYVHGLSAFELGQDGPLRAGVVAALCAQIARRLEALHAQGLAHLDLKPSNILIDLKGRAVLVDPHSATLCGTSGYAAPEQARGEGGGAADWYGLGRTAAALWSGASPRDGRGPLPDLPEATSTLDGRARLAHERLAGLIEALATDDPRDRGASADEFTALAHDLGAADGPTALAAAVAASPRLGRLRELQTLQRAREETVGAGASDREGRRGSGAPEVGTGPRKRLGLRAFPHGAALAVAVALVGGGAAYLHRPAAPVQVKEPTPVARTFPPTPTERSPDLAKLDPIPPTDPAVGVRPLAPEEEAPPDRALFTYFLKDPAIRLDLRLNSGPVGWRDDLPAPGHLYKFALRPGSYALEHVYPHGHIDFREFSVRGGEALRWESNPYRLRAPRRHLIPQRSAGAPQ